MLFPRIRENLPGLSGTSKATTMEQSSCANRPRAVESNEGRRLIAPWTARLSKLRLLRPLVGRRGFRQLSGLNDNPENKKRKEKQRRHGLIQSQVFRDDGGTGQSGQADQRPVKQRNNQQ